MDMSNDVELTNEVVIMKKNNSFMLASDVMAASKSIYFVVVFGMSNSSFL